MLARKNFVIFVFFAIFISGCNESSITNGVPGQNNSFSIPAWDYSDNHYFIDTLYKTSFLAVMNDSAGILPQNILKNKIKYDLPSFQVWVQCDSTIPFSKFAVAWILLGEKPYGGYDSVPYRVPNNIPDTCLFGFFRELNTSEYYIDPMAGFIGLKISIPENFAVAVTYETDEGKKFGEGKYDVSGSQAMILKMIKCANQHPDATPRAWELKMKNVYRLPYKDISQQNFILGVKYSLFEIHLGTIYQFFVDTIPGMTMPLNQILLIDRYTGGTKKWKPDGIFDWMQNRTIIPETGDIIFPTLYPFRDELRKYVTDTNLIFREIYTERKIIAQNSIQTNYYYLNGNIDTLK
jgi:hypothetical protein